jgi:hypothetical protein
MNIERNCADPLAMGYEKKGILINRDDVDFGSVVFDAENNNIISTLALKEGKFGFWVYQHGSKPFNGTNKNVEVGELGNSVTSNVHIVLPDHSPAIIEGVVDPVLNGEFLFISFNKHKGLNNANGASAFEVHGFYQGLTISEGSRDAYSEETGGGWAFTLTETKAPKAGLFLFDTDYATTEAMVNSLVKA